LSSCGRDGTNNQIRRLAEYRARLDEIGHAVEQLQSDLSELEASVTDVRAAIDEFDGRNWAASLQEVDEAVARAEEDFDEVQAAADEVEAKVRATPEDASSTVASRERPALPPDRLYQCLTVMCRTAPLLVLGPEVEVAVTVRSNPIQSATSAGTVSSSVIRADAPVPSVISAGSVRLMNCRPSTAMMWKLAGAPTLRIVNTIGDVAPRATSSGAPSAGRISTVSAWNSVWNRRWYR
jgi:hypothetical protein